MCVFVFVFVFVTLRNRREMRIRHIVICGLTGSTIFFHITYERQDFRKKIDHKMCFHFLYNFCVKNFSF